jgi:dienelactone hydrolase
MVPGRLLQIGVLAVALLVFVSLAPADEGLVIMKDGFALQGNVKREQTFVGGMKVPKADGFFMVISGPKITYFSPKQLLKTEDSGPNRPPETLQFTQSLTRYQPLKLPAGIYDKITQWDQKWDRTLTLLDANGQRIKIAQRLTKLTPDYACVEAKLYDWSAYFMTSEMDPEVLKDLLYSHPDLKQTGDAKDVDKRFRVVSFFARAKMLDMASAELDRILKDFPAEKERVEAKRKEFRKFVVIQFLDLIELANKTGRHTWAQTRLAAVPPDALDENMQARTRALATKYDELNKRCTAARKLLGDLFASLSEEHHRAFFAEVLPAIAQELNLESAARLETFISQAQQAERERAKNRTDALNAEQLLSLAVTSWVLGANTAEAKLDSAQRLWKTRKVLLQYLETSSPAARQELVKSIDSQGGTPVDEMAAVIKLLPPPVPYNGLVSPGNPWILGQLPFPEATLWNVVATTFLRRPATHVALQTALSGSSKAGSFYLVQAPPEYAPGRFYPVIIALHENGADPTEALSRWGEYAARHGYFLVAPAWEKYSKQGYQFTVEEQAAAVDVLRDLRRRFWIDSDRVFIAGFSEGGNMALDVAYSHPDLFAGVICIAGKPKHFSQRYWRNAQYLPTYFIDGGLHGDGVAAIKAQLQEMCMRGFPAMFSMYLGRGQEWFPGEMTSIFDWLDRKKRVFPFPELGRSGAGTLSGQEFYTMRPTDDHFYWLSGVGMNSRNINDGRRWNAKTGAAYLQGKGSDKNHFNLDVRGFKRVVLWLNPAMVDFEKPLTVYVNAQRVLANKKIQPSMQTLLEDFYQRGDQSQLYFCKLELTP